MDPRGYYPQQQGPPGGYHPQQGYPQPVPQPHGGPQPAQPVPQPVPQHHAQSQMPPMQHPMQHGPTPPGWGGNPAEPQRHPSPAPSMASTYASSVTSGYFGSSRSTASTATSVASDDTFVTAGTAYVGPGRPSSGRRKKHSSRASAVSSSGSSASGSSHATHVTGDGWETRDGTRVPFGTVAFSTHYAEPLETKMRKIAYAQGRSGYAYPGYGIDDRPVNQW